MQHRSILNNAMIVARQWGLGPHDRYCNLMPFFHTAGVSSQYLGVAEAERVNQVMEKAHLPAFHVGLK